MVLKVVVSLPSVLLYLSQWGSHQFSLPQLLLGYFSKSQGHSPKFWFLVSGMGVCVFGRDCGVANGRQGWGSSAPCWTVTVGPIWSPKADQG